MIPAHEIALLLIVYLTGYTATFFILIVAQTLEAWRYGAYLNEWLSRYDIQKTFIWSLLSWWVFAAGLIICVYFLLLLVFTKRPSTLH